jgi:quercetin dioxygenase-like cupin family protein
MPATRRLIAATSLVFSVGLVLGLCHAVAQEGPRGVAADAVKWGGVPPVLPKGGQMAGLSGDPSKTGTFTVRLKMPAGYKILPHKHPHSERVTVIAGELRFGTGDKLDEAGAARLGPGGFVDLPANTNHYAFATVDTVIQIAGEGPFGISYANPADDPSKSGQ